MKKTVALEPLLVMEEERVMIKEKKGLKTMERNTQNGLDERKKKEGSSDGRKERRRWKWRKLHQKILLKNDPNKY